MPMVADIVSAQILRTPTTHEELAKTIRLVYTTLSGLPSKVPLPNSGAANGFQSHVSGPCPIRQRQSRQTDAQASRAGGDAGRLKRQTTFFTRSSATASR